MPPPRGLGGPCPAWVHPAWWATAGTELRQWRGAGPVWIAKLASAWGLIRTPETLTVPETLAQTFMINFYFPRSTQKSLHDQLWLPERPGWLFVWGETGHWPGVSPPETLEHPPKPTAP